MRPGWFFVRLVASFVLYGFLGYLFEAVTFEVPARSNLFEALPEDVVLPFLPIYGFGGVVLACLDEAGSRLIPPRLEPLGLTVKTLTATLLLSAIECASGLADKRAHGGVSKWSYEDRAPLHSLPYCQGFCSLTTSLAWLVASLLFFIADPVRISINTIIF
jgi:uncharacterized membrane protein